MNGVFLEARSMTLTRVLSVNSTAVVFDPPQKPRLTTPGTQADSAGIVQGVREGDVKQIALGGVNSPYSIFLQPYCESPSSVFWLNVWGFSDAGSATTTGNAQTWVPFYVCTLQCASGMIPGPGEQSYLAAKEYLCDTLLLQGGTLGSGYLSSPGNDMAGYAKIDLLGARHFEVEFAADPASLSVVNAGAPGMNALWRPL